MGKKAEFKAWKKRQKQGDDLEKEFQIPIEGFFSFYVCPWDHMKYFKFPCRTLWVGHDFKAEPVFGAFESVTTHQFKESYDGFMSGYLGTVRLEDTYRMSLIVDGRTEIVIS